MPEPISQAEVLANLGGWGEETVDYSQETADSPTGHRDDCSGYASMVWGLPTPGLSTVTLVTTATMHRIEPAELGPGDAVAIAGPNTGGDAGHIMIVESYDHPTGRLVVWEQTPPVGPQRNTYQGVPKGFACYRLDTLVTPETAKMIAAAVWGYPLDVYELDAHGVAQKTGETTAGASLAFDNCASWTAADVLTNVDRLPKPGIRPELTGASPGAGGGAGGPVEVAPASVDAIAQAVNDEAHRRSAA